MELVPRNQALNTNYGQYISFQGGRAEIAITVRGSDWYWAVTAIMMFSSLVFLGLSFTKPRSERAFHYITTMITMVASIAYFSMASNIGWAPSPVEFVREDPEVAGINRQIFYVRYIDWVVTTPLLLMDLLLTAGLPWGVILFTVLLDEIMIVTGLVGALVKSSYKWGYYTFGCIALLYIGFVLIFEARSNAYRIGRDVGKTFLLCGTWTFFLWMLYPIAWGICEGGNLVPPDSEAVFYGILDILAKPVFGGLLLWGHRKIDPARLGMKIGSGNYFEGEDGNAQVNGKGDEEKQPPSRMKSVAEAYKAGASAYRQSAAESRQVRSGASTRSARGGGYSTPSEVRYARNDGSGAVTSGSRTAGGAATSQSRLSATGEGAGYTSSRTAGPIYTTDVAAGREAYDQNEGFGIRDDRNTSGHGAATGNYMSGVGVTRDQGRSSYENNSSSRFQSSSSGGGGGGGARGVLSQVKEAVTGGGASSSAAQSGGGAVSSSSALQSGGGTGYSSSALQSGSGAGYSSSATHSTSGGGYYSSAMQSSGGGGFNVTEGAASSGYGLHDGGSTTYATGSGDGGLSIPSGAQQVVRQETNPDGTVTYYTTYTYTTTSTNPPTTA